MKPRILACAATAVVMLSLVGGAGCTAEPPADAASVGAEGEAEDEVRASGGRIEVFADGDVYGVAVFDRAGKRLLSSTERFSDRTAAEAGSVSMIAHATVSYAFFDRPGNDGLTVTELLHRGKAVAVTEGYADWKRPKKDAMAARAVLRVAELPAAAKAAFGAMRFALFTRDGQWQFELRDRSGHVLLASERYRSQSSALAGIDSVHLYGTSGDPRFEIGSTGAKHELKLVAYNGESIAWGGTFDTKADAERAAGAITKLLDEGVPTIAE